MPRQVSHILAGLIIGAVVALYALALTFTGLNTNRALGGLSLLIIVVGLVFFIHLHSRALERATGFGELFSYGFKATAIATLVGIGFQWVFYTVFPEYQDQLLDITRDQMVQQGKTEDQIGPTMARMREYFWPMTIGGALFTTLLTGAIGSLIGAGMARKG